MSRRNRFAVFVALALAALYFGVTTWIRAHVDDLIQHAVGRPLPEFAVADTAGGRWSPASLRGKRAVLHFFRSRCHSCDVEAAAIRELEAHLPADVVLLHVMTDLLLQVGPEETAKTLAAKGFRAPVAMADAALLDAFHKSTWSQVTPITYVVDAGGVVRYGLRGAQTREAIERALAAAK